MAETEETPQQRQARIRQAKRDAKLKAASQATAQERLDKITKLAGRTPESMRNVVEDINNVTSSESTDVSGINTPDPDIVQPTSALFGGASNGVRTPNGTALGEEDMARMQQDYMRALLGGPRGGADRNGSPQTGMEGVEETLQDPMMKMMQSFLANMSGDPNAPPLDPNNPTTANPFAPGGAAAGGSIPGLGISARDISNITGIPFWLTSAFLPGTKPAPTDRQVQAEKWLGIGRIILSILLGVYTIFVVNDGVVKYGRDTPGPATIQNPFLIFVMLEAGVVGGRGAVGIPSPTGVLELWKDIKSVLRDGAIIIFLLGWWSWWRGWV